MTTNGEKQPVSKFEVSREVSSHYFKSSFARSMFCNSNQSKSLDFMYFDNNTIDEENENDSKTPTDDINITGHKAFTSPLKRGYSTKAVDHKYEPEFLKTNSARNQNNNAITFWKRKQIEASFPREGTSEMSPGEEIASLRQECQRLVEDNHRLQQTMDSSHQQTQVDTLQWQLKQAESSRQMYRAVLEQVSKFLERVHKNLDQVNGKPPPSKCKARSRSVHTVASCSPHSRPVSPSPSTLGTSVHRANSISQIQDSHTYSMFRDISWRSPRSVVDEVPPEKLSQEAFRLLRTVQSLLGTREPDLAQRLTPAPTPTPASDTDSSRDNTWCVGSCSSLLPLCNSSQQRKSLDASSCSSRADGDGEGSGGNPSTPQLSVGSTEDESGFSSMSSFHEVGLPEIRTYPEVGLPIVEPSHRRWSSTPVENQSFRSNSSIQVLWV